MSVLGRTGIRWGEARAMLVRDFIEVPMPMLHVVRNQPEGTAGAKAPKSGRAGAYQGRTLHDLRHTAACEWILRGVPLTTVQAWLGRGSIEITARHLHHLGDSADRSALHLLNDTAGRALSWRTERRGDSG